MSDRAARTWCGFTEGERTSDGWNLPVVCDLPPGHDGPHCMAVEPFTDEYARKYPGSNADDWEIRDREHAEGIRVPTLAEGADPTTRRMHP